MILFGIIFLREKLKNEDNDSNGKQQTPMKNLQQCSTKIDAAFQNAFQWHFGKPDVPIKDEWMEVQQAIKKTKRVRR